MWWYKVTSRGKDCSEICTQYHSNKSDTILAQRAQQCISDKEIWIKVQKNGLEGYVSNYFLDASN